MDDQTRALVDAAFHAWITLGDLCNGDEVSPDELASVYAALTIALDKFPPPPSDAPPRA